MYINLNLSKQMTDVKLLLLHYHSCNHLNLSKQMFNSKKNYSYEIELLETISCGVMVKALDCGNGVWEFELLVALLNSLSDKYPWERYEPPYLPSYGLNSTNTVLLDALALNNLQRIKP